jgi:hypothetical protein
MCFDFLYKFCLKYFSFQEEFIEILSQMYIGLHVKHPLFWSDFNETWTLSTYFQKNTQVSNVTNIRPLGAECSMHTDGQTDRQDEANSPFSQFCERA